MAAGSDGDIALPGDPFPRLNRGRWHSPAPCPGAVFGGTGTLSASATVITVNAAALNATGTLGAAAVSTAQARILFSAASGLTARAAAGPDADNLWTVYQAVQAQADLAEKNWEENVIAGGMMAQSGMSYPSLYELQLKTSAAYAAWLAARNQWIAQGYPGRGPR